MNYALKRKKAISEAETYYNHLFEDLHKEDKNFISNNLAAINLPAEDYIIDKLKDHVLKYTPISYADYIYNNMNFQNYVKYSCVAKRCQKKINFIRNIFIALILLLGVIFFLISKNIVLSVIITGILFMILIFIFKMKFSGETYDSFYKRTMYPIIYQVLDNFEYHEVKTNMFQMPLHAFVNKTYTKQEISNKKIFSSSFCDCEIFDLKLINSTTNTYNGKTTTTNNKVFDGFNLSMAYKTPFNKLKGAKIQIREDDHLLSSVIEDTVDSMFENDRIYHFNTEELNKALDCTIEGENNYADIDELMMEVNKIITPLFEEFLLYLKKRYNSFNLTITDQYLNFNVSLDQSTYQKIKSGNFWNSSSNYKEFTKKVSLPNPTLNSVNDYCYYAVFPMMEHLFLMKYFDEIFKSSLDDNNPVTGNVEAIKSYQDQMVEISETALNDFKKKYKNELDNIYEESLKIYNN